MTTPIPTPFDIIDPDLGPLLPTGLAWLLLLACAGIGLLCVALLRRTPRPHSLRATLRSLLNELRAAANNVSCRQDIERVARIARRLISLYTSAEVASMSCSELLTFAKTLKQHSEDNSRALSPLILLLSDLEERAYAPISDSQDLSGLHETLRKLVSGIEEHITRFQPV
jgi:hypothetical protein